MAKFCDPCFGVKIWQKILLGFLLVFVLISLSGVPTSIYYGRILEAFQTITDRDLVGIDLVNNMEKTLLEMNSSIREHRATHEARLFKDYLDEKRRWLALQKQLQNYVRDSPRSRSLLERINTTTRAWMEKAEQAADEREKGGRPFPTIDETRALYRELFNQQRGRLYESYETSVKTVEQGGNLAWALRTLALVVGLLVCAVVIRSVKKPLDRLTRATEAMAGGRFESIKRTSDDELGQLTNAFNLMSNSLKERTAALEEQRRLAVQASELKTEFLANTSHELRTPLNTIMGYCQLILDGLARNRDEERSYLTTIQQSSRHLLALINDILDIARIEAGQLKLELEPVLVKETFGRVEEHFSLPVRNKGLRLAFSIAETDLRVRAHAGRLGQVLLNLVGNAVKFTHSGSIEVAARTDETGGRIWFSVRDTGIGIPQEKQERLFQKFVQADGSMTRHFGGSGLGLVLSRNLVGLMGGSIELHSDGEGRGTTVRFVLKREEDAG